MDIPNLRQQFLSENLKILRRPTPKQENTPYLPILLKVMMKEERITFSVYLKVSEGEKGEIKFLPYLEQGETLQTSWVESLERVGIGAFISMSGTWIGWWPISTTIYS